MNLVETVLNYFGGDVIGKISSLLGEDQNRTRSAVTAAVPALLAGLAGTASTTDGARKLFSALGDVDDNMLGNVGGALSSKGSSLIDKGSSQLSSLLGGGMLSKLGGVLSKFTGIGGGSITSLLGLLGPLVLGILKKQKNTMGLDASGLANLLAGQKQNIANAMPAGLAGMLGDIPGLSQFAGVSRGWDDDRVTTHTAPQRTTTTTSRVPVGAAAPRNAGSLFRWLVPLVLLAVGAWLLYSWLNNRTTTPTVPRTTQSPPVVTTDRPLPSATDVVTTLNTGLKDAFTSATTAITSIKDAASAQAALPKLQEFSTKLDSLKTNFANLTGTQRSTIATLVGSLKSQLQTAIDKVMTIPGVSDAIKPTVDAIMQKLNTFTA
jgi:hypothetical protein